MYKYTDQHMIERLTRRETPRNSFKVLQTAILELDASLIESRKYDDAVTCWAAGDTAAALAIMNDLHTRALKRM